MVTSVASPQLHQVVGSNPQPQQPIVIFSNHNQPTVLLGGQQMTSSQGGGVTPLPQAQSFVIMGQQPGVMPGSQPQPIILFGQQPPQGGAAVNVQYPGAVYESIAAQNPAVAMNGEPGRRGNKNGDGDEAGVNM